MTARFYGNGRVGAGRRDARRRSAPGWRAHWAASRHTSGHTASILRDEFLCARAILTPLVTLPPFSMYTCSYSLCLALFSASSAAVCCSSSTLFLHPLDVYTPRRPPPPLSSSSSSSSSSYSSLASTAGPQQCCAIWKLDRWRVSRFKQSERFFHDSPNICPSVVSIDVSLNAFRSVHTHIYIHILYYQYLSTYATISDWFCQPASSSKPKPSIETSLFSIFVSILILIFTLTLSSPNYLFRIFLACNTIYNRSCILTSRTLSKLIDYNKISSENNTLRVIFERP